MHISSKRIDLLDENQLDKNQSRTKHEILSTLDPKIIIKRLKNPRYLASVDEIKYAFENSENPQQEWDAFIHRKKDIIYEFINKEYLNDLSNYLVENYKENKKIKILEVGAGNGKLTYHLRKLLEEKNPEKFKIKATDLGEWEIETLYEVEKVDLEEAIKKHKPNVIICSWMPFKQDFTEIFRKYKNVQEYILIGDPDVCGDQWKTYGNRLFEFEEEDDDFENEYGNEYEYEDEEGWYYDNFYGLEEDGDEEEEVIDNGKSQNQKIDTQAPRVELELEREEGDIPYEKDGFVCRELVSNNQICRSDYPGNYSHSKTFSFTRNKDS
ncbi:hypothetical protein CL656_04150 [bacterium]|nr:hypothetical protein [bacterium]|tara:strand:- start:1489 stop:2463 length:975 start_codon:yes stop_codon:yes gene_type:complete